MFMSGIWVTINELLAAFVITILLACTSKFEVAVNWWLSFLTFLCKVWTNSNLYARKIYQKLITFGFYT
jgi:hypothetical protein